MTVDGSGFTRLGVDERRHALLECGRALFTTQPYDELSMAAIAREAGISKALLYHYFPSKQAFFVATLQDGAMELAERVRPDESAAPRDQLDHALDAWLAWVETNHESYAKLLLAANGVAEVREIIDSVRDATAALILSRLIADRDPTPEVRAAVCGWLWFMDGVCLEWVRSDGLTREAAHGLLMAALPGILRAAGAPDAAAALTG